MTTTDSRSPDQSREDGAQSCAFCCSEVVGVHDGTCPIEPTPASAALAASAGAIYGRGMTEEDAEDLLDAKLRAEALAEAQDEDERNAAEECGR